MPESITPEVFREALYSHKHTLPQLRRKAERVPAGQRAAALLAVFADPARPESAYRDQAAAGDLLVALKPEPQRPLIEILRVAAPVWNVSVEQLPFYLREVFGREAVVEAAQRLAGEFPAGSREASALLTVSWWLSGKGNRQDAEPGAAPNPARDIGSGSS